MRIRTTKPEFYKSEDMARLPLEVRFIFQAVWSYVDDNGVGRASVKLMASDIFPLADDPHVSRMQIACSLQQLIRGEHVVVYEVNERPYIEVINWQKHQYIARPNKPRYPSYSPGNSRIINLDIQCACKLHANSLSGTEDQGIRGTEDQSLVPLRNKVTSARDEKTHSALRIVHGWTNAIPENPPPTRIINDVTAQVQALVHDGINPEHIAAGLTEWWQGKYPASTLPNYVTKHSHGRGQQATTATGTNRALEALNIDTSSIQPEYEEYRP